MMVIERVDEAKVFKDVRTSKRRCMSNQLDCTATHYLILYRHAQIVDHVLSKM